jgi:hypothetical protein
VKIFSPASVDLFHRISDIPVCREYRYDILDPLVIIAMFQSVQMRKDVRIVAVRSLHTGRMRMRHVLVLRYKRVREVCNLLFPYR